MRITAISPYALKRRRQHPEHEGQRLVLEALHRGRERDPFAVRRNRSSVRLRRNARQALYARTVCANAVDLVVAVAEAREGDPVAAR